MLLCDSGLLEATYQIQYLFRNAKILNNVVLLVQLQDLVDISPKLNS